MDTPKPTIDSLRIDRNSAPPAGRGWLVVAFVLVALLGAGGVGVWWWMRPKPVEVKTALALAPSAGADRTLLNASGYVTARRGATVSAKVTGKVVEVLVEEGMAVELGQVLARLDSTNAQKDVELSEAQLGSAQKALGETEAELAQARADLARSEGLYATKDLALAELEQDRTAVRTLEARLEKQAAEVTVAERQLAVSRQSLDDTVIRAPFAGVVTSKDAQPGEMISPMSAGGGFTRTGICTIVDMASLEVEVDVNESYINRVRAGMPVVATLDSYPSVKFPAKVIAIIPTADRVKATVKVRIGFDQLDARILPDMSVKVAFQSEAAAGEEESGPAGVTVPKGAVREEGGRKLVWVVRGGKLEKRFVTVSQELAGGVEIAAGLSGGEMVVVDGPADLVEGAVVVEQAAPN